SAALEATLAWIHNQRGELRRGIAAMRRAYPQFIAAGGDQLPDALQRVIFPVAYGGLIERYARQRNLDPFLVAALVAQESTFQADARSVANALGLMQILPSTGRKLARAEGLRRFSAARLTDPEFNVRLGTRYYAGLVNALGGDHLALASYNAGKSRVDRWLAERQDLPQDEFVDDIPFPETQNYVKRIIGTAEDYRRLYGEGGLAGLAAASPPKAVPAKRSTKGATAGKPRAPSRTRSVKPAPKSSKAGARTATGSANKPAKKPAKKQGRASSPTKVSGGHVGGDGRRG
ncbi:MAG: lytic transglycosylase domain-containing protein, partial [Vicinamibacterales bacterium]|nr:lytic transglycosylase domain-containing protein [Vicinamibacterales bacterium]